MIEIKIPTECPACDFKLQLIKDQLFCRNTSCNAQISKKLEHFTKVLGIKGLGSKTLEKLQVSDLAEIFYLDVQELTSLLGSEKLATKLFSEIENAKGAKLHVILNSFSIPLIGETASKKICAVVKNVDEINEKTCKEAGLGEKATENLLNWLAVEFLEIRDFLPFSYNSSQEEIQVSTKGTVCITGKLISFKTKAEATKELVAKGFKVVDSLTKDTQYLVDEQNNGSSKRQKAEENGIPIINNLKTFLEEN